MNIQPVTPSNPVCFGIACHVHGTCQRYAACDHSSPDDHRIGDCGPEHALYVPILPAVPA